MAAVRGAGRKGRMQQLPAPPGQVAQQHPFAQAGFFNTHRRRSLVGLPDGTPGRRDNAATSVDWRNRRHGPAPAAFGRKLMPPRSKIAIASRQSPSWWRNHNGRGLPCLPGNLVCKVQGQALDHRHRPWRWAETPARSCRAPAPATSGFFFWRAIQACCRWRSVSATKAELGLAGPEGSTSQPGGLSAPGSGPGGGAEIRTAKSRSLTARLLA